jgi:protein-disulfide isomerase
MASRTKQKEAARAKRLAEEQARQERERRQRRLRMIAGVVIGAVAVVAVAIAISSSGGGSHGLQTGAKLAATKASVNNLLAGIPQSGSTLGKSSAPVTVTEFGDLQCPICRDFALNGENQLISNEVRTGKVKLVYRSLMTATGNGPNPSIFPTQQAAALAAGVQQKAWQYILLFYHQQGTEDTNYVNTAYLNGLARQVAGLNFAKWNTDRQSASLTGQVTSDQQLAASKGFSSTPSLTVQGPKGSAQPIVGDASYSSLQQAIKSVS